MTPKYRMQPAALVSAAAGRRWIGSLTRAASDHLTADGRTLGNRGNVMYRLIVLLAFLALSACDCVPNTANLYPDKLKYTEDSTVPVKSASSYEKALQVWKSPEDINGWIAANFSYDTDRAIRLSESRRRKNESVSIYSPSGFFETKTGVCVDLSRFTKR